VSKSTRRCHVVYGQEDNITYFLIILFVSPLVLSKKMLRSRTSSVVGICTGRTSLLPRITNYKNRSTVLLLKNHGRNYGGWATKFYSPSASSTRSTARLPMPNMLISERRSLFGSWARRNRIRPGSVAQEDIDSESADVLFDAEDEVEGYFSKMYERNQRRNNNKDDDEDDEGYGDDEENISFSEKQYQMRQALLQQRGRLWEDPMDITEEDFSKSVWWDDIPDWTPDVVSLSSLERVKVLDDVPTLSELQAIRLPPPPPILPSADPKAYVQHRKHAERHRIYTRVSELVKDRVEEIVRILDSHDKQNAVDELFESIEQQMRDEEGVLLVQRPTKVRRKRAPPAKFEMMVEYALAEYLQEINKREEQKWNIAKKEQVASTAKEEEVGTLVAEEAVAKPLFVDFTKSTKEDLLFAVTGAAGQIKEEWSLAALKSSQRVMLRKCMSDMAKEILEKVDVEQRPFKIFVQGRKGVGKSTALTLLVASARESGYIVLFLPDGDRYRKNGKYVEPCTVHKGMFILPVLAKEMCQQLLDVHGDQMDALNLCATSKESLSFLGDTVPTSNKVTDLLRQGAQDVKMSSGCYSCVVATLMEQTAVPFVVVMDEYNTYYEKGEYFHEEYDNEVVNPIPLEKISFFSPFLSIGSSSKNSTPMMKRGGIVAAITHNRSVAKKATEGLVHRASKETDVFVVDVPRYSKMEVEHVLANYECIGIGKLRFDNGETINNAQEVEFLRMMSGAVGARLLDAAIWSIHS